MGQHMNSGVADGGSMKDLGRGSGEYGFSGPRLVAPIESFPGIGMTSGDANAARGRTAQQPDAPTPAFPLARRTVSGVPVTNRNPGQGADEVVARVARSRVSVLITGETGAGKEVFARRVHDLSPRADKPLVTINCAAVCASLIDSELFGYERGAFTGADRARMGLVEAADGGTLFLDEVGELSLAAQAKLLRVIETRLVLRVGGLSPRLIDVRFIAATNRDLDSAVSEGSFREDLLFRLEGIRFDVLPLRARGDEILPAARLFLKDLAQRDGLAPAMLAAETERALLEHTWTGNFRELRNVIERASILCKNGVIRPDDLLLPEVRGEQPAGGGESVDGDAAERHRIVSALSVCAGNQTRAAKLLGMSRRTLVTRLEILNVPRPRSQTLRSVPVQLADQS
jgi:two-component system, NtrC family, response regulator AtoC